MYLNFGAQYFNFSAKYLNFGAEVQIVCFRRVWKGGGWVLQDLREVSASVSGQNIPPTPWDSLSQMTGVASDNKQR